MHFKFIILTLAVLISTLFSAETYGNSEYIVKFKSGQIDFFLSQKSMLSKSIRPLRLIFGDYGVIKLNDDKSLSNNIISLMNSPEIEFIEPNYKLKILPILEVGSVKILGRNDQIQDSKFDKQWGLNNTGTNSGNIFIEGLAGADINAVNAWDITKGSREVIVAVIDTGINYNHRDLKGNMWVNKKEATGRPGIDDDGNGYIDDIHGYDFQNNDGDPQDDVGHGTHCAGVIGATHNRQGVAGVMGNVQIMAIKFLGRAGGEVEDALKSFDYAIRNGADILSNSWGGNENSVAMKSAINAMNDFGILFVAASGNDGQNNDSRSTFPANFKLDNVISVGAMTGSGNRAGFSNYGESSVHVFAPGSKIYSTYRSTYKALSGTSMAAPFVSGIAGLLLSVERGLTPIEIRERLINTSVKRKSLNRSVAKGWVDAYRALTNKTN